MPTKQFEFLGTVLSKVEIMGFVYMVLPNYWTKNMLSYHKIILIWNNFWRGWKIEFISLDLNLIFVLHFI